MVLVNSPFDDISLSSETIDSIAKINDREATQSSPLDFESKRKHRQPFHIDLKNRQDKSKRQKSDSHRERWDTNDHRSQIQHFQLSRFGIDQADRSKVFVETDFLFAEDLQGEGARVVLFNVTDAVFHRFRDQFRSLIFVQSKENI